MYDDMASRKRRKKGFWQTHRNTLLNAFAGILLVLLTAGWVTENIPLMLYSGFLFVGFMAAD
jgi:hypothetical protein